MKPRAAAISGVIHRSTTSWRSEPPRVASSWGRILPSSVQKTAGCSLAMRTRYFSPPTALESRHDGDADRLGLVALPGLRPLPGSLAPLSLYAKLFLTISILVIGLHLAPKPWPIQ